MIYDCFTYHGGPHEEALFKLRRHELNPLELIHVVVEADHTFTGKPKEFTFKHPNNVRYIEVTDMPNTGNAWDNEAHQRNCIMRALDDADDNDIIIISDLDEIPRTSAIAQYKPEYGPCALVMDQMYYYLNVIASRQSWRIAKILSFGDMNKTPDEIRRSGNALGLLDAGHHFSYLGGVDAILKKLESFSHQEEEVQKLASRPFIDLKIRNLESLWDDTKFSLISLDELPQYTKQLPEYYVH